jgi:polar amino acid transport system substrate-binding protein/arginine/ornithine transport system substrate-binding protein
MQRIAAAAAALAFAGAVHAQEPVEICVEGAYPPFSEMDNEGEVVGFDIDIANALCDEIGVECDLVPTEWDAIIPALEEDKCDAIVASMSITEERRQRIDFSEKYYQSPQHFVAAEGADWEDTNEGLAGKRVCVQRGTIHQDYLEGEFPDVELVLYPTQDEVYLDLASGRCDAIMGDTVAMQQGFLNTEAGEGYAILGDAHVVPEYHGDGAGIGVRKSDAELRDRFSQAIQAIRESGEYEEIQSKYFDFDIYGE